MRRTLGIDDSPMKLLNALQLRACTVTAITYMMMDIAKKKPSSTVERYICASKLCFCSSVQLREELTSNDMRLYFSIRMQECLFYFFFQNFKSCDSFLLLLLRLIPHPRRSVRKISTRIKRDNERGGTTKGS